MQKRNNRKRFTDAFVTTIEASIMLGEKLCKKLDAATPELAEELGIDCAAVWMDSVVGPSNPILLDLEKKHTVVDPKVARA